MKIKLLFLLFGISISHLSAIAQKKEFKFGKIELEEFNTKASGIDSAAAALKLFDVGNCYFEYNSTTGFRYVYERHIRYKILTKAGYDLANYKIGLYRASNSAKEDLTNMDAATYNMADGKMVISKLTKDAKFTEEFNKNYTYKKFTLPNVKEGSILEFKYTIKSDFIFNLRGWSFQSDIPTLHSEYNVKIPEYLMYKTNYGGYLKVNRTKHENINSTYVSGLNTTTIYDQYLLENVPAFKDEAFITTTDDYIPSVEFELQGTHFPNDMYKDLNGSWPKIAKELAEDENFGLFVNRNAFAKTILPGIVKNEKDTLAVAKLIFDYVKNNIKFNDAFSKYASTTNPKSIFEKKSGNSADINLCLLGLLKEAKIDARPLLVSTRENGMHPGYPMISKFNNVLVHIFLNNNNVLLDATDADMAFGMVAFNNLNHEGLSVDLNNKNANWITTEPTFASEKMFNYALTLDKDNSLKGNIVQYAKGYAALNIRDKYRKTNNEIEFLKDFKKDKTGLELKNYKMANLENLDELLTETMEVVIEDNVEEAGNLVYFTPLLFEKTKENPFKHEERLFPVDFAYPIKESFRITVNFPEDYEIEKLPTGSIFRIPDNKGSFTISYLTEGRTLLVKSVIDIPRSYYTSEDYFYLKSLFKSIVEKQAEQIVFKKKAE